MKITFSLHKDIKLAVMENQKNSFEKLRNLLMAAVGLLEETNGALEVRIGELERRIEEMDAQIKKMQGSSVGREATHLNEQFDLEQTKDFNSEPENNASQATTDSFDDMIEVLPDSHEPGQIAVPVATGEAESGAESANVVETVAEREISDGAAADDVSGVVRDDAEERVAASREIVSEIELTNETETENWNTVEKAGVRGEAEGLSDWEDMKKSEIGEKIGLDKEENDRDQEEDSIENRVEVVNAFSLEQSIPEVDADVPVSQEKEVDGEDFSMDAELEVEGEEKGIFPEEEYEDAVVTLAADDAADVNNEIEQEEETEKYENTVAPVDINDEVDSEIEQEEETGEYEDTVDEEFVEQINKEEKSGHVQSDDKEPRILNEKARPDWFDWEVDYPAPYIDDIYKGISFNDRYEFVKELFNITGNLSQAELAFKETLDDINAMDNFKEIVSYIRSKYPDWDEQSDEVYRFYMIVRRKFNK